jgi:DNA-binding NarL/FixJ family response regulator
MIMDHGGGEGVRVLVIEDVRLHRENLVELLRSEAEVADAVGSAGGEDALARLGELDFEVVLVSVATTGIWAVCRDVVAAAEPGRVIAYAVSGADNEVLACAAAGISGYLLRTEPYRELVKAVLAAVRGDIRCPPSVAAVLMRRMGPQGAPPDVSSGAGRLTAREREILALIDDGMSNKEIARRLSIEVRTVKNHVHNLLEKLQVHRRGEAAALLRIQPRPTRV